MTAIAVAGLAAGMPSMVTRPAPISSAACCRERASPRRTSSASTRARRVTCGSALLDRFQRAAPAGRAPPRAARRWRRCPMSASSSKLEPSCAGSGSICQQLRDLGADLVGVGTHLGVHASRFGGLSRDQRSMACRAVSSPRRSRRRAAVELGVPHRAGGGTHHRQRVSRVAAGATARSPPPGRRRRATPGAARCGGCRRGRMQRAQVLRRCSWAAARRSARTVSAAVLTPQSTSRLGRPAALAPAMSVSRRSPTTSGVRNLPRDNASVNSVGCGLARHLRLAVGGGAQRGDHRAVSGQQSPFGRQRLVDVRGDPQRPAADGQRRLGEVGPAGLRRMALHDGDRIVGPLPDGLEADVADLGGKRVGADDEHRRARRQLLLRADVRRFAHW